MFSHLAKQASTAGQAAAETDRVVLTRDRRLWWPASILLFSSASLFGSFWVLSLWLFSPVLAIPGIIGSIYFALGRPDVVLSAKEKMLEVQPG
ncbi:MAG: hypothetical protein ACRD4K_13240, partial [Candidatus Acidiferrales bacterium]